jgi:hypothetical protein
VKQREGGLALVESSYVRKPRREYVSREKLWVLGFELQRVYADYSELWVKGKTKIWVNDDCVLQSEGVPKNDDGSLFFRSRIDPV